MIQVSEKVKKALASSQSVVALESTVISHGLPYPSNIEAAFRMEEAIRNEGSIPAFIGILKGEIKIGLNKDEVEYLATSKNVRKTSMKDLPIVVAKKGDGATTVAATSFLAHRAGIRVFATGGIGGVHRGYFLDVSADLPVLARTPIVVVCSGAKAILDLQATREWLETYGICVIGYKCEEFPAFYSARSGFFVDYGVDSVEEATEIIRARDSLKMRSAILMTVPVPSEFGLEWDEVELVSERATEQAVEEGVKGKDLTPFLLKKVAEFTKEKSLIANIELLVNNANIAAKVANELSKG